MTRSHTEDLRPPYARRRAALRRWTLLGLGALALIVLGWSAYWHQMAGTIEARVDGWFAERRADGWQAENQGVTVSGYPFEFVVRLEAPVLAEPDRWRWQGPQSVEGWAFPLDLETWHVAAPGAHRLVVDGRSWEVDLPVTFETLDVDLAVDGGRFRRADVAGSGAVAALADGREVTLRTVEATVSEPASGTAADTPAPVLDLEAELTGLHLPPGTLAPFEDDVPVARLAATLKAPLGTRGPLPERLAAWRDAGGVLDITRLSGGAEPLEVEGDGTVAVDAALQPLAAFRLRARGAGEAVDRFHRAGLLEDGAALAAKVAVGALGGADGAVETAVTVQDRTLYVGKLAVTRLPRVTW